MTDEDIDCIYVGSSQAHHHCARLSQEIDILELQSCPLEMHAMKMELSYHLSRAARHRRFLILGESQGELSLYRGRHRRDSAIHASRSRLHDGMRQRLRALLVARLRAKCITSIEPGAIVIYCDGARISWDIGVYVFSSAEFRCHYKSRGIASWRSA